ncbi:MAG TPA: hypothetical protein DHM44_03040, partial [Flexistipes sinusarabici]|nr:hypothetical protein [Flexistipes sinusarabici]
MVKQVLSKAKSVSEICREHNIHPNQYYRWQRERYLLPSKLFKPYTQ